MTWRDSRSIVGGRSAGARVACRTAADVGAVAVLCLAFPVHPPGKGDDPSKSRMPELDARGGAGARRPGRERPLRDAVRRAGPHRCEVPGNHSLRDGDAISAAISDWLPGVLSTL